MRFLTGCFLTAFLVLAYNYTRAQAGFPVIHGKVSDERHLAAEASPVMLFAAADSSIVKHVFCDKNGRFTITVKPGKYMLLVSRIGYAQIYKGPYELKSGDDIAVPEISLSPYLPILPELKEVSITAQREYIEVKPDRTILNVQSSPVAQGNSALEILQHDAPGVHADTHGNISMLAHQNALITIDNKPVSLTGQDLYDYLQSIQGNTIQRIEEIYSPSAKYDAAGAGIINIVLKKSSNAGTNVTVNAGAGYGNFYKANAGVNFNNRMGKVNVFGNYSYADNKADHKILTDRTINYRNILSDYDVDYYATLQNYNHNFRIGTDYAITVNHTLGVLISGTNNNYDKEKNNSLYITNQGILDSIIKTKSQVNGGLSNISYDINYSGKLDTAGKTLSADFVFNNINRRYDEDIDNNFYNAAGSSYRPALYLQNLSPSGIRIWASKIDYANPLSKTALIEMGIKFSWVKSNNDLVFGPKVNGVYQSSSLSNNFIYNENINAAYINYTNNIGKVNLIAGLRAEQTNSDGNSITKMTLVKKNYLDWFPHLKLNYSADEKNEFNFSYDRGLTRPPYELVNPFVNFVDLYDYKKGNPNLLPQYTNNIQITHTYNKILKTTLYGMVVTNFSKFVDYVQNDSSKVSVDSTRNFGTYYVAGLKFYAPVTFTTWWDAKFLLDIAYQRLKAYPGNGDLDKGTPDINFSSTQHFTIGTTIDADIIGKYESPNFYGIGQNKSQYEVNADISKKLFNKNGTLSLGINDIFNTYRDRSTINYQNLNMTVYDKIETRKVTLNFTYRFGNISLKGTKKHDTGNEEEQNRAGGVAGSAP